MAVSALSLYVDVDNGVLYNIPTDAGVLSRFALPNWIQYTARTLNIYPIRLTGNVSSPFWNGLDIDNITLRVGIGVAAGAQSLLAYQDTWTKVYNSGSSGPGYFTAVFNLNTTEMNAAISSSASYSSTFEIQFSESGYAFGAYQCPTTILAAVMDVGGGGSAPTPASTYLNRDDVLALFNQCVRFTGNTPGASIKLDSLDGTQHVILRVNNDGSFSSDPQT